ncbi:MAG: ABC transporter ATP-binding protein [Microthrixaceae bacterium]
MLIKLLRNHLGPFKWLLVGIVFFQFLQTLGTLFLPTLNAEIIDKGVVTGDTDYIWRMGGVMMLVTLAQIAFAVVAVYFGARMAMGFGRDVRADLFHTVTGFSTQEVGLIGAPSLITRVTNDVQQVQMVLVMAATLMVAAPIMATGGIILALRQDVGLSALLLVSVPALVFGIGMVLVRLVPQFRAMQERLDAVNGVLREQLMGIRVVRAFVREPYEGLRFGGANANLTETSLKAGRYLAFMFPFVMVVLNLSSVSAVWIGGDRIDAGDLQIGELIAFLSYLIQILMSVMMATFMAVMLPRAAVSADRIQEVLDTPSSISVPDRPVTALAERGVLELRNVGFGYPGADAPVLQGISLTAAPGETTAIIGSTGSGKTTLLNLIPRFYDATEGEVIVDGENVRQLVPELLWSRVGMVPQKPYLFSGTVASNLRFGDPDATDSQLWEALEVAQARDFVADMDGGLDARIAQGGSNVSGGQRQRLAIARALVRKPGIYLFDDSFSALDLATDARLREALVPWARDATVIVVGQRVASIRTADRILVLEDGRQVGLGTHDQLVQSCPTYQEIVESQRVEEPA